MSTPCPICNDTGSFLISKDPDEEDLCTCIKGDSLRTPGEMALKLLMHAFDNERTLWPSSVRAGTKEVT